MTNLDSILKSRDITLPAKVHLFNAMVFLLAMYGCESWTTKKAEQWRIDAIFFYSQFYLFIYFTILYWFCHTFIWICHGCTYVPHPEPLSDLPPHHILVGHLSAPALSAMYHASNLDWRFVSQVRIYMFKCRSPISSRPLPLSQSPKSVLYICVSFAVSQQDYSYHLSKVHTYALVYCIGVFLFGLLHSV